MAWYLIPFLVGLVSCGSVQKMALRSTTPIFERSSLGIMREGNWDFFQASAPANIKFIELIWEQDQNNDALLAVLVKTYAGYAFAVHESLYFGDQLAGIEDSAAKKDAIIFYTRALDYGLLYLKHKDITVKDLLSNNEDALSKKLKELDEEDAMALLYTAQAWGSLINLQKDNVALVSQVSKVKALFDRVCKINPNIDHNVCDIFYAQYDASRPKMLGGNPENGEKLFLAAIKNHPQNLLIRMGYIQYFLIPSMDGEKYEKEAAVLKEEFAKWDDLNRDNLDDVSPYRNHRDLNLYNAIAKKRFLLVEKYKSKIF
jgi:hypothetical protein